MKQSAIQTSFNGGEIAARMGGRVDLEAWRNSVAEMTNMVPLVQGPALKRSGTRYVAPARSATVPGALLAFRFNPTQHYVIEAGDQAFRFYTNDGRIETAPGVAMEVATPYLAAQLPLLRAAQSNDVLYLVHRAHAPRRLVRTSATSFALSLLALTNGPFRDLNSDEARTVYASAATGAGITLTASTPTFEPGHVGSLFLLEARDFRAIPAWEPGISTTVNAVRRSDGKIYRAVSVPASGGRTGSVQPTHTTGQAFDGMSAGQDVNSKDAGGVLWEYVSDRSGVVEITGVTSATVATATVRRRLPDAVVGGGGATSLWAQALFSDVDGWPTTVCLWNERLILARDNVLAGSVVGDFANFARLNTAGEATADMAFVYRLATPSEILWLSDDRELLVGTAAGVHTIGAINGSQAPAAGNLVARRQSARGSEPVEAVSVGSATVFVQAGGRKVREAGYDFNVDRYTTPDITVRAPHITRGRVTQLAYQQEPESLLWAVRGDGALLSFTYSDEQQVRGWSRHWLGGFADAARTEPAMVEDIVTIRDPAGERDQLWLLVRRWINGAPSRTIELLEPFWEEGDTLADARFSDASAALSQATPFSAVTGLTHLRGETVSVLTDGAVHPDCVVSAAGSISLVRPARAVVVGLPYAARIVTLKALTDAASGTGQGKRKRMIRAVVRLLDTLGLALGQPARALDQALFRRPDDPMDSPPRLESGDYGVTLPHGFDRDAQLVLESRQPLPWLLLAIMPETETGDA